MKKLIIISLIAFVSCEEKHSKEYYDALNNYNKAKENRLKVEHECDSLLNVYTNNSNK